MKVKFDSKEMNLFLREFNPYVYKYYGKNVVEIPPELLADIINEEKNMQLGFSKISSEKIVDVYRLTDTVYSDSEHTSKYSALYSEVQEKFIRKFVGIEGLDELYQPLFFVFEWMMHLEYNPEHYSYSYYRDHFVHQVRNMYEMFMLLSDENLEILDSCITYFENDESFLAKKVHKVIEDELVQKKSMPNMQNVTTNETKDETKRRIYRYFLLSSAVVTSLVHDIGYAIQFLNKNIKRMQSVLPISNYFFGLQSRLTEIYIILQDSLLFQTIGHKEIKRKVEKGDHGAISACILLLKYYTNGNIFSLDAMQKMVIELSALTIYDHTLEYRMNDENNGALRYQNVFTDNPFSFLFRICDDIEEWDRVYFDITKQSNFLVCDKCKTIIRKYKNKRGANSEYACCCSQVGYNMNAFKYDRLARVRVCEEVSFRKINIKTNGTGYAIHFKYHLAKLLQASAYNPDFARKRAKGIIEVKKALFAQRDFGPVYVGGFISGNPIAIKTEIMMLFLKNEAYDLYEKSINSLEGKKIQEGVKKCFNNNCFSKVINTFLSGQEIKARSVIMLLRSNLQFYANMAVFVGYLRKTKSLVDDESLDKIVNIILGQGSYSSAALRSLVANCVKQATYYVSQDDFFEDKFKYKESYMKMYGDSELDARAIESYIKGDLYDWVRMRCQTAKNDEVNDEMKKKGINATDCKLDFYSDYYIFSQLYNEVNESAKN